MSVEEPEITAAYERAASAYEVARSEVYSRYPEGIPPRERLSQRECEVIDAHEREQSRVKALRQERRARSSPAEVELTDEGGGPSRMRCRVCGEQAPFDERLPYVNQTASFSTGHDCVVVLPDDTGGWA